VYFVSLAPISDPAFVGPTIAQTLGLREAGSRSLLDHLKEYLHAKHLLLVLDNFEQVVTAAPLLAELLAEYPLLEVLVTSREALRLSYERLLTVAPLALPDLNHLPALEALPHYAAVALFMQRVRAVKPDFQLTAVNARTVVEICARLDGLLLAIELAARMRLLSPQQLLARLGRRLQVLTGGVRDLPMRQQTLRDTIRWSYDLLNREERRLFRLLAVFVGGCTLEVAEAVCRGIYRSSGDTSVNVLDAVISLLDKHLLQQREQEDGEPRLFMLETIREYGLERLQVSGEMAAIRWAHASYYLTLAEEVEPRLFGEEQIAEFDRLEREHENLRAALQWFMEREEQESALHMSGALVRFWSVRGYVSEGRKWLEGALAAGEHVKAPIRAKALNGAGWLAFMRSDYERAEESCGAALELYRELGDARGAALSLHRLGQVALRRDSSVRARALLEESLALYRQVGDKGGLAYSLMILAGMLDNRHEADLMRSLLEESLALFKETHNKEGMAWSFWLLGSAILSRGAAAPARLLLEEGLALFKELNLREGIAQTLGLLGQASLQAGDDTTALSLINESLTLARELGTRPYIGYALILLARVAVARHDISSAWSYYEESLALYRELNDKQGIALSLEELASLDSAREHATAVQPTTVYPAGLTAREVDVLRLVARGLTDAQVAERLVLSPRTVNAHLRSIYSKLNVTSRTAATRCAVEHHLV
jgi:predicted ATPase/DNA-binding CsgD family transcriptional regulator